MSKHKKRKSKSKSSHSINRHLVAGKSSKTSGVHHVPSELYPSGRSGEDSLPTLVLRSH